MPSDFPVEPRAPVSAASATQPWEAVLNGVRHMVVALLIAPVETGA